MAYRIITPLETTSDPLAISIGTAYRRGMESYKRGRADYLQAGRELQAKKKSLAHGAWLPWLKANEEALGFGELTAQRLMKMAAESVAATDLTDEGFSRRMWGHGNNDDDSGDCGNNDENYTPPDITAAILKAFGRDKFPLDAASPKPPVVPCQRYFTRATDGLARKWDADLVFLNPPYGKRGDGVLQAWIAKAIEEFKAKRARKLVLLLPARLDTSGMKNLHEAGASMFYLIERLKFSGLSIAAPWATVICVLGASEKELARLGKFLPDNRWMRNKNDDKKNDDKDWRNINRYNRNDECYTLIPIIEDIKKVMGAIDLDAASSAEAQLRVKAKRYYSKADDALTKEWKGRVFLNPPYSDQKLSFVKKFLAELEAGRITEGITLTLNKTETQYGQALGKRADAICFWRRPIMFHKPKGIEPDQWCGYWGHMLCYFGPNKKRFADVFGKNGFIR